MTTATTDVFVSVGDGAVFRANVTNWPEGTPASSAPEGLGSYWPPMGVEVID